MQIIETGALGTRSAVLRLRRKDTPLEFVVFPMLHVADPRFYAAVTARLRTCHVLVVEGVRGRTPLTWALTATYRVMPRNRRSGLVVCDIPFRSLGIPLITPDVDGAEFTASWQTLPLWLRMWVWCLIPVVVVRHLTGGRNRLLAPDMAVDDDDFPESEADERLEEVFGGERDRRLLAALTELHHTRSHERIDVAVVYGAAHVGTLVHALAATLGYLPREAEWLTVLDD